MDLKPFALAATFMALGSAATAASWACETPGAFYPESVTQLNSIASDITKRNLAVQIMYQWDVQYMRSACEKVASGGQGYVGCLNGHRDWSAIQDMYSAALGSLGPSQIPAQVDTLFFENSTKTLEAYEHCRALGVVE